MRVLNLWSFSIFMVLLLAAVAINSRSLRAQTATDTAVVQDVVVSVPPVADTQLSEHQSQPVAATIVTQDQIEGDQITNLQEAKKLEPSLQYKVNNIQNLTYNVRGFGNSTYSQLLGVYGGVPIYLDGVYLPRPGVSTTDVVGLNGVTVLKGPQSTAGGWDSTGGAIFMTTALPTFVPEQRLEFTYGSYNLTQFNGSVSGPIGGSDKAAFSLGFLNIDRDGYIYDVHDSNHRFNSWHDKSARAQVLLQPDNDLTVRLIFDFSRATQQCCINLFNGAVTNYANGTPVSNNFYTRAARFSYTPSPNQFSTYTTDISGYVSEAVLGYGASADVAYNLNGFTLSSLTAFRDYDYYPDWRTSQVVNINTNYHNNGAPDVKSVQQQFKVDTPKGQKFEATAGVFYYYEAFHTWGNSAYGNEAGSWYGNPTYLGSVDNLALNNLSRSAYANDYNNNIAPFAQGVWHTTPQLDFTGGIRYSYTQRSGFATGTTLGSDLSSQTATQQNAAVAMRQALGGPSYSLTNPSYAYGATVHQGIISDLVSASYKFTPDALGYALYSHGGRPGGPNTSTAFLPAGAPLTLKPETLNNYEIGLKTSWLDDRVTANVAAYVMTDRNYIVTVAALSSAGTTTSYLANANGALSRGVELDLRAKPIDGLSLFAAGVYDDAYFTDFKNAPCPFELSNLATAVKPYCDETGKPLSLVSKWTFTFGGEYRHDMGVVLPTTDKPLTGFIGGDFTYQTSFYSTPDDSIYSLINGYGLLNLHAGLKTNDDSWTLTAWVHNALNKHYFITQSAATTPGGGIVGGSVGEPLMAGVTVGAKF